MDAGIAVPFTTWRIGVDPIIGLVPGLGDAAGAVLGGWVLLEAVRLGASRHTLLRMAGNIAVDALAGLVPLVGDIVDAAFKANLRNVALLERHAADPRRAGAADRRFLIVLLGSIAVFALAVAAGSVFIGAAVLRMILR